MPNLYIIAGPNGAGKTTASFTVLPELLDCRQFVNADEIARGLSPFDVESVAFHAARIMLQRIAELLNDGADFAIETTLATKTYRGLVQDAQQRGYSVTLVFFWLQSPELAIERVKLRVSEGGHNIPTDVIERRFKRGINYLVRVFTYAVNKWVVFDNSFGQHERIASGTLGETPEIYNHEKWSAIHATANEHTE